MLKKTYRNLLGVDLEFGLERLQLVVMKFDFSLANEDILVKFWMFVAETFRNKAEAIETPTIFITLLYLYFVVIVLRQRGTGLTCNLYCI